ncbi:MFS transporter [Nocardia jejuensis]|uniref:MFS transporter n=1 Tax=Nocardia jejuensis TaxID=328049 RepID=UPI000A00A4BC|nr:MFS transporter [Nocardia jejuensis]
MGASGPGTSQAPIAVHDHVGTAARTPNARAALMAICLGFFMILLDGSALNIALPSIQADTGGSMAALQWLVNIYTIPLAALLLSAGTLADRIGARRVFLWALGGFSLASLICALSPSLLVLLVFRCVQGTFAAGVLPTTLAIIARTYPDPAERARAITVWGATGGIALVAGPIGGGLLTETLGWRSIFFINVPIGAVALWLAWRHIGETARRQDESFDWLGQLLAIAGLGVLVAGLIEGGERGWSASLTVVLLGASIPILLGFVLTESRVATPILPLAMFGKATFSASIANGFAFQFGAYGLQFMLAIFLQSQWGYDARTTGLFFVPFALLWTFATLVLNRRWSGRGMRWLLVTGSLIAAAGALICLAVGERSSWPILLAGTAAVGFGCGLFGPSCNGAAMAAADPRYAGLASGVLNTSRQIGMAIGIAVLGVCLVLPGPIAGARVGIALTVAAFVSIAVLSLRYVPGRSTAADGPRS